MRPSFIIVACSLLLGVKAAWAASATTQADGQAPAGWNADLIAPKALFEYDKKSMPKFSADLLAWRIEENPGRSIVLEECIVSIDFDIPTGGKKWRVAHLFRHLAKDQPNSPWNLYFVNDGPGIGLKTLDKRPTSKEIADFLPATNWSFKPDPGWKLHEAGLNHEAWQKVTGEPPDKSIGPSP